MIWQTSSRLRPLAGATWLGLTIWSQSAAPGTPIPPITGDFSVEMPAPAFVGTGLARHFGGVPQGRSVFETTRARREHPTGSMQLESPVMGFAAHGVVGHPAHGGFAVMMRPARVRRMTGTVDDRPVLQEEAFLLGYLLGSGGED